MAPSLPARLSDVLRDRAQREALVDGQRRVTYSELWAVASAFAAFLAGSGLRPGARVALILPNGVEAVAAVYGAWLAGAIVVPLNAQGSARDFATWLGHCEPEAVVFDATNPLAHAAAAHATTAGTRIAVSADDVASGCTSWQQATAATTPVAVAPLCASADAAMILYTSGTTGAPKGVTLSHGNLAANVAAVVGSLRLTGADTVVTPLPFFYAYGASVLHSHLAIGARVVLEHSLAFPQAVMATISREQATGFSGVASTYALLLSRVDFRRFDLRSLRYVTQAGSAMPVALTQRLVAALPDVRLFVMYGQTEATSRLTCLPAEQLSHKPGSVGLPVADTELQVRDSAGHVLSPGEQGEVWVRGPGVMLGYWRDPEATRSVLDGGWLRTGDLGYLDAEGYLYLAGRRSDMIKTGAHRVNPQEVEETIAEFAGVAEVAVAGVADALLGQVIKAFVVPATGAALDVRAIRGHCRARMAAYKVPKSVEIVASLPRTASGKVRRAALQEPAVNGTGEAT